MNFILSFFFASSEISKHKVMQLHTMLNILIKILSVARIRNVSNVYARAFPGNMLNSNAVKSFSESMFLMWLMFKNTLYIKALYGKYCCRYMND